MLLALRARGLAGTVKFVGFDASEGLIAALTAGEINGLVVQNPLRMGELGVQIAAAHLSGQAVETRIDTGVALITRESMTTPEHAALLKPDPAKYLSP